MSYNSRSISEVNTMAQMEMSPEMQFIFQSRPTWHGSVSLSPETQKAIATVRAEVKSGMDYDGWKTVAKPSPVHSGRPRVAEMGPAPGGAGGDRFGHLQSNQNHQRYDNYRGTGGGQSRNGGGGGNKPHHHHMPITSGARAPTMFASAKSSTTPITKPVVAVASELPVKSDAPAYNKSMFRRADKTVDEIIVDRLQGYLTKFAESNYDYTKTQLINFLESDDNLSILPEFMKRFFKLAATSDLYYHLYARLLSDLDALFPYIHEEIGHLYKNFLDIFKELSDEEVSVHDTEAFNKYCDGKKYRTGYSRFITELIKYNSIETDYFLTLVKTIVNNIDALSKLPGKSETVQEFASCIEQIIKVLISTDSNPHINKMRVAFSARFKTTIEALTKASEDRPSLVFRARYIMEGITKV